jgi:hypothetical protein
LWGILNGAHFLAATLVGVASVVVLSRESARRVPVLVRLGVVLVLAAVAAVVYDTGESSLGQFGYALAGFGALAILLVGGPPLSLGSAVLGGIAIAVLAGLLFLLAEGWSWLLLAGLAVLSLLAALYALLALRWSRLLIGLGKPAYSAFFDHDDPPFYKSFLRVDVRDGAVEITCFGVKDEHSPTELVDRVKWSAKDGWTSA